MDPLLESLQQNISHRKLLQRGQAVLVAVSGGVDSMVLLYALYQLSGRHRWRLSVAHLNHQLRGRSSAADERLVRRSAQELNLPLHAERADVRAFAQSRGVSLEMAARELRHEFLARVARRKRISTIALAHHADDQLELFFLRLLRGSGSRGLAGVRWRSPSPSDSDAALIRPLLDQPKEALRAYAQAHGIRFRDDLSNTSLAIQRNRIRHKLLPLLRRDYQPQLDRILPRVIEILRADSEFIEQAAGDWLNQLRRAGANGRPRPFSELAVALQRAVIQAQSVLLGIEPDFVLVEKLRCRPESAVSVSFPSAVRACKSPAADGQGGPGLALVRTRDGLVRRAQTTSTSFNSDRLELELAGARGRIAFGGARIQWEFIERQGVTRPKTARNTEFFDADMVGTRILLRHRQAGDRFQPIGMECAAKLQDLLTNLKVPRARRQDLVVAVSASGAPFWVEGVRPAEGFKLRPATNRRLRWHWQRP